MGLLGIVGHVEHGRWDVKEDSGREGKHQSSIRAKEGMGGAVVGIGSLKGAQQGTQRENISTWHHHIL